MITVVVLGVSESSGTPKGMDVDLAVTVDQVTKTGQVTLVPSEDPWRAGEFVSWGEPSHWVDSSLLSWVDQSSGLDRSRFRAILNRIEREAAAEIAEVTT